MKSIYKYTLEVTDRQLVRLPAGAVLLTVQTQHGQPQLWALVDPEEATEKRTIEIYGTGHPVENADGLLYISTFQLQGGMLVFHVFERVSE